MSKRQLNANDKVEPFQKRQKCTENSQEIQAKRLTNIRFKGIILQVALAIEYEISQYLYGDYSDIALTDEMRKYNQPAMKRHWMSKFMK